MLQDYRDWLGADSYEAVGSIGGSLATDNIEDYYVNPFELGYGFYIGWKTDFIGKDALTKMKDQKNRKKVTLEWNRDDLLKVVASNFEEGVPLQVDRLPAAELRLDQRRRAAERQRKPAGMSMFNGYSYNERCMLSLGIVNDDVQDRRSADAGLGRAANDGQNLDRAAPAGWRSASALRRRRTRAKRAKITRTAGARKAPEPSAASSIETNVALGCRRYQLQND